jgi:uncharacterized protein
VLAFDDGAFRRGDRWAPLVGVAYVTPSTVEGIVLDRVRVDGLDATDRILQLVRRSEFGGDPRAILLDGITVGGFNVVDARRLYRATGRPIITVTRKCPDYAAIRAALRRYFPKTLARRWRAMRALPLFERSLSGRARFIAAVGCTEEEALALLERTTMRGSWPEPLRVARLVARATASGRKIKARGPGTRRGPVA